MFRRILISAAVLLAFASSATALASGGYNVRDASWHRPPSGTLYSVTVHGVAAQKALVYIYLDRQPCRWTWATEARRNVTSFQAGQSYFKDTGKALLTKWVTGHFDIAFTARAGATAEREDACAYLTVPNPRGQYRLTKSHASNIYYVTG
jgi:hypothetical protein